MSTNTSCTDTNCPQLCCTLSGYCINPNSTLPQEKQCKFYYNSTQSEAPEYGRGLLHLKIRQTNFPAYYAVPLIAIGTILIVIFCILAYRYWKKKKQQNQPKDNQSNESSKPTQTYHQAFSQSSANDLVPNGTSEKNLILPSSIIIPKLSPLPNPQKNAKIINNPQIQMNYQQFQAPLQSINESLKNENGIDQGKNKNKVKTQK